MIQSNIKWFSVKEVIPERGKNVIGYDCHITHWTYFPIFSNEK